MLMKNNDVIGTKLDISHRTKEYEWNKNRFEKGREQELFKRELMNFAQKIMDKISNDIDNNQQTPQSELYSLMNILKNLPQLKSNINSPKIKQGKHNQIPVDIVKIVKRDILGME